MKKNNIYIILLIFFISCHKKKCKNFDFEKFKIDTIDLKKDRVFINKSDSLIFKLDKLTVNNMIYEENKISSLKKCNNGLVTSYYCDKVGFNYETTFYVNEKGNFFNFFNKDIKLSSEMNFSGLKFNKIEDLNFEINSTNPYSIVKKITIKNGEIISFVDEDSLLWKKNQDME
jgi:hypothetical protein